MTIHIHCCEVVLHCMSLQAFAKDGDHVGNGLHLSVLSLQACRLAAANAADFADRAATSAASAEAAVKRCKVAMGDAQVLAEAEAAAKGSGEWHG